MFKIKNIVILGTVSALFSVSLSASNELGMDLVSDKVSQKVVTLLPAKSSANAVTIAYRGTRYTPPIVVESVAQKDWKRSTPIESYRGVFSANRSADAKWIESTFVESDRASVAEMMSDNKILKKNSWIYSNIKSDYITQLIEYGDYIILLIEHENKDGRRWPIDVVFKSTKDGWLVTNELSSDLFYTYVLEAIR